MALLLAVAAVRFAIQKALHWREWAGLLIGLTLIRGLLCERERVANHLGDIGAICNDAAFALMHAHCGVLRERVLRALNHHDPLVVVADPIRQAEVWAVRAVGLGILMSLRGDAKPIPFIEDAAVPVEHLAEYIMGVFDIARRSGVERVAMYAHASAGCLHVRPVIDLKTADGVRQIRQIAEGALELLLRYGGTTSGEHGEGLSRGEFSARLFGPELTEAFHALKSAFDPQGIMNPGKVLPDA